MSTRMNITQVRDALAQTMSEEMVLKGEVGVYTKDGEGAWKLFDENVCTLLIYKQPMQDMYRVVAMTPQRKCIINSWIKATHSLAQTPSSFVEVLSSAPLSPPLHPNPETVPLDGVGFSFTDPNFFDTFVQQFTACLAHMAGGEPPAILGASSDSLKVSQDGVKSAARELLSHSQEITKSHSAPQQEFLQPNEPAQPKRGSTILPKSASAIVSDMYGSLRGTSSTQATKYSAGSVGPKSGANMMAAGGSGRTRKFSLSTRKTLKSVNFDSPNIISMQSVLQDILTTLDNLLEEVWNCLHCEPQIDGVKAAVTKVSDAIQMLSIITAAEYGEGSHAKDVVLSNATAVQEELASIKADSNAVTAVEKGLAFHASALRTTAASVGHHAVTIRGLTAQIENIIGNLRITPENDKPALLLVAITRALATSVSALCSAISTYTELNSPTFTQCQAKIYKIVTTSHDVDIWQEVPVGAEVKVSGAQTGSLNQLIALLLTDTTYDNEYMKMFITMYESFTNPYILLEKLTQRHKVPESVDQSRVPALQLRVCVLLKYWVENHGDEFDDDVASKIGNFIENVLKPAGHGDVSNLLAQLLRKKIEGRKAKEASLEHIPPHMTHIAFSEFSSPADLLLLTPPTILAEQLTLIDFAIFKDIESRELQNQAWLKAEIKACRSPNILRLINRSTQVSYWAATMILMHTKVEDRVKVWEKFIEIAKQLLKLNNYNTLMSILAGLNNSCVFRLKKTKKKLLSGAKDVLAAVEKVMNTQQSFKNYRTALKDAHYPCLPYLGVHLSDLVFIEEGNADIVNGEINIRKRELIYGVVSALLHYQQYPFTAQKHATYDFLAALPNLNEKELYTISTFLEPRK